MPSPSFESFEEAFRGRIAGPRRTCDCGATFWDTYNTGYSWEEGEVEALENDPTARRVEHAIGTVEFEGRYFVDACDCWHPRAERIIAFINGHAGAIATLLTLEKRRKQDAAERSPVVGD